MFWLYSGNVSPINNHYYLSESRRSFEWMLIFFSHADAYQCFIHVLWSLKQSFFFSQSFLYLDWGQKRENEALISGLLWVSLYWMVLKKSFQFLESGSSAEVFPNLAPSGLWNLLRQRQEFKKIGEAVWRQQSRRKKLIPICVWFCSIA